VIRVYTQESRGQLVADAASPFTVQLTRISPRQWLWVAPS